MPGGMLERLFVAISRLTWVPQSDPDWLLGSGSVKTLKEIDMNRKRYSPMQIIGDYVVRTTKRREVSYYVVMMRIRRAAAPS